MATQTQEIKNMRLISHHDLNGFGNIGEGVHLHQTRDGRRILYMAHESAPKNITSVDVTDLNNPKLMVQTELAYNHLRSNSLSIVGDTMVVAYQSREPNLPGSGMGVYNISNPEEPEEIGFLNLGGEYSRGCHCLWWVEGSNYAHLATGAPDFQPRNQKDDQFYMIVDMSDPTSPQEAGRWWYPGTREGDEEPALPRHPKFDAGNRLHNANVYPERPNRAYCAYLDAGAMIVDISDIANPKMLGHINFAPSLPGFTHTVLPLFSRELMVVTQEAVRQGGEDYPKLLWMVDMQDENNLVILGSFPMPDTRDFFNRPGRFGAHNVYENQPGPTSTKDENRIYATLFNAGVRVYDIQNPSQIEEIAYWVPPLAEGAASVGVNDVYVDENGILYVVDRIKGGLDILEMTI
ncbi:MAG: LVIVD repeat-containing protein [Dehalococcoidia bacterium]